MPPLVNVECCIQLREGSALASAVEVGVVALAQANIKHPSDTPGSEGRLRLRFGFLRVRRAGAAACEEREQKQTRK